MSKTAPDSAASAEWSSLEPYAQLLRALLPRMSALSIFDPRGTLHWSTAMAVAPELQSVVAEAVKESLREPGALGVQRIVGNEPIYLFWLLPDRERRDRNAAIRRGGDQLSPEQ